MARNSTRYALVLSTAAFNQLTGLVLACPITQGGGFARTHGFAVPLTGVGTTVQGVVLCHQVRVLSYAERNARLIEKAPAAVVDEWQAERFPEDELLAHVARYLNPSGDTPANAA